MPDPISQPFDPKSRMLHRPFETTDLPELLALLSGLQRQVPEQQPLHPGDLLWWMLQNQHFDAHAAIETFRFADGRLAGFTFADPADWTVLQFDPSCPNLHLPLDLLETRAREKLPAPVSLKVRVGSGNLPLIRLLQDRGHQRAASHSVLLAHQDNTERAPLPAGHSFTCMAEFQDLSARVQVHQQVWNSQRLSVAAYESISASAGYDPSLDLLVLDPAGIPAACALMWLDPCSQVGVFEPVGTHPDHRKKGLGLALMQEGVWRLQQRGAQRIVVSTSSSNRASLRLYEAAGFRAEGKFLSFSKGL